MTQTTPIRVRVVFLLFVVSGLLYLDRFVLTYVARYIKADLALTESQITWALSAFFWSYALMQVPAGWLTDRFGPRKMLTLYILAWSAATAAMGWVHGLVALLLVRGAVGIAQAGAYPACASLVGRWVPMTRRGSANALVTFGGRLGSGLAPLVTAFFLIFFAGRATTPSISEGDILSPLHLAEQVTFAADHSTLPGASEATQARLDILRRVDAGLTDADRAEARRQAADYQRQFAEVSDNREQTSEQRVGAAPPDSTRGERLRTAHSLTFERSMWKNSLQQALDGPLLASPDELTRLPAESELHRLLRDDSLSNDERQRANRLILEVALPGSLKQLYAYGWRPVMLTYGAIGILVAVAFWWIVRDRPADHPRMTADELADIEAGRPPVTASGAAPRLPIRAILTSRSLWLISLLQLSTNIGWTFLVTLLPTYLTNVQKCSLEAQSWHSAIPLWAGWGGMLFGGWFTDWCRRRFGLRIGRMIPLTGTRFLAAGAFVAMMLEPSLWLATAMFCLVAFSTDVGVPAVWAYNQDVGGRFIASVLGWGNMWGNIGSALSPIVLNQALQMSGNWKIPFLICAASFLVAGVCGLAIDATKPIDAGTD